MTVIYPKKLIQHELDKFQGSVQGNTARSSVTIEDPMGVSALKLVTDGDYIYIATAAPGSSQTDTVWQCKKIDKSNGLVITFADGDSGFNNKADNLPGLSYS